MDITDFTSYDEVRTTVGLSTDELPDTLLAAELYANVLQLRMSEVSLPTGAPGTGTLASRFTTVAAIAEGTRTELEQKLYMLTRIFATYVVAQEVAVSLSMRAPKSESDGKRTLVRFSPESTYEITAANIKKQVEDIKLQLETLVEATVSAFPLLTRVVPAVDVVTNV